MKEQVHGGDVYRHPGVLDFSSNLNPLGTPKEMIDAVVEGMSCVDQYPDVQCTKLRQALYKYEGIHPEQVVFGNGAAELIFSVVNAAKPKKALLQAPTFAEYGQALEMAGCDITYVDTFSDGFHVTDRFLEQLEENPDIVFLCNPNNPTGFLVEPQLLLQIVKRCDEKGIRIVVDECFLDFIPDEEPYTLKGYLEQYPQLFILKAFTKRYAMAGLRLGYALCGDKTFLEKVDSVTQPWNISLPAQVAGAKALELKEYVTEGLQIIEAERPYMIEEMKKLGLRVFASHTNYIFFEGPKHLKEACLKHNILIRDCSNYVGLREGFYRVAVKMHEDNEALMQVLSIVLAEMK